jgi:hypothetical protein
VECHILKKIAYFISKISIPRNERKQTGPYRIYLKNLTGYEVPDNFLASMLGIRFIPVN